MHTFNATDARVIEYTEYDNVGNRWNMLVDGNEHNYTYDVLYQLTSVDYPGGAEIDTDYYYDAVGSRTSTYNGSTTTYNRNSLNQYTSVGGNSCSYDNNGSLTNDGTYRYYYDCENRLTQVKNQNETQTIATYKYDFAGRRVIKIGGGTSANYVYDGDRIVAEFDDQWGLLRKYIYGSGIDEVLAMIEYGTGDIYYYHYDGLGSVIAITDEDGDIVETYSYDVFGKPTIRDGNNSVLSVSSVANRFMFTGREYDYETGNYYYRARYYKPDIGRFLSPDPIGYADSMNLYQYCLNNPVNYTDPLGLNTKDPASTSSTGGRGWGGPAVMVANAIGRGARRAEYAINAGIYAAEGGLSTGIGFIAGQARFLRPLGTVTFAVPTPSGYTQPITIDFTFIGTAAGCIDTYIGDWLDDHADDAFDEMGYWWYWACQ